MSGGRQRDRREVGRGACVDSFNLREKLQLAHARGREMGMEGRCESAFNLSA